MKRYSLCIVCMLLGSFAGWYLVNLLVFLETDDELDLASLLAPYLSLFGACLFGAFGLMIGAALAKYVETTKDNQHLSSSDRDSRGLPGVVGEEGRL